MEVGANSIRKSNLNMNTSQWKTEGPRAFFPEGVCHNAGSVLKPNLDISKLHYFLIFPKLNFRITCRIGGVEVSDYVPELTLKDAPRNNISNEKIEMKSELI